MKPRDIKNLLYEQVSIIGKSVSSPKRLELIEILCQGEKSVDQLAADAEISVKLASAHLKELRISRLVEARREGKNMYYRLADPRVANLWVELRSLAEERLLDLQTAMRDLATRPDEMAPISAKDLLAQAKRGEIIVIDVRPQTEYNTAHLPYARSIPVTELKKRINEIPRDKSIVAYCRGPFCLMAKEAVEFMRGEGIQAQRIELGIAEWRASGLPVETEA